MKIIRQKEFAKKRLPANNINATINATKKVEDQQKMQAAQAKQQQQFQTAQMNDAGKTQRLQQQQQASQYVTEMKSQASQARTSVAAQNAAIKQQNLALRANQIASSEGTKKQAAELAKARIHGMRSKFPKPVGMKAVKRLAK